MRLYGTDVDLYPTIFTRDGKKGMSSLIADVYDVKFKIRDGLQMVHVQKATEDDLNSCPVVVLKLDMV